MSGLACYAFGSIIGPSRDAYNRKQSGMMIGESTGQSATIVKGAVWEHGEYVELKVIVVNESQPQPQQFITDGQPQQFITCDGITVPLPRGAKVDTRN
jgi:cell division GTPase FtsZ